MDKEEIFKAQNLLGLVKTRLHERIQLKEQWEKSSEVTLLPYETWDYELHLREKYLELYIETDQDDPSNCASLTWEEFLDPEFEARIKALIDHRKEEERKNALAVEDKNKKARFALYQKLKKEFNG